jgi:uncharacterized membrane protein YedE/YeeE
VDIVLAILAVILAMVIGFAVQRASLCNVKAVAELISTKRAHMLGSFLKTVMWVVAVTFVIEFFFRPGSTWPLHLWGFGIGALAGGFVFGIGAAVNGGCALGTLGRLGNGDLRMLLTLFGLVAGLAGAGYVQVWSWLPSPEGVDRGLSMEPVLAIIVTAALSLWALSELWRLWRNRDSGLNWRELVLADRYRLSTAALLLGISNGFLFSLFGPWSYTRTARTAVNHVVMGRPGPGLLYWFLFVALLGGVLLSSLTRTSHHLATAARDMPQSAGFSRIGLLDVPSSTTPRPSGRKHHISRHLAALATRRGEKCGLARRSFVLDWRFRLDWLRNLLGGILMGVGVTMAPGGNDVLIFHAIPSGSPHALPAYAALLVGTAAGLLVIRMLGGTVTEVECTGDVCRIRTVPKR